MRTFVTGHRPDKLGGYYNEARRRLEDFCTGWLAGLRDTTLLIGMAQGFDQAMAVGALANGIPFEAYVPCEGQEEVWPTPAQERYRALLKKATVVHVLGKAYSPGCMNRRNQAMVDSADNGVALYLGSLKGWSLGGTADAMRRANKAEKPVVNWRDDWLLFCEQNPLPGE